MLAYLTAFIFYTLAMIGILVGGFIIYKKTFAPIKSENKGIIEILDSHVIAPKKTLLVVKVKDEKFLIALDSERTTFLSKLEDENKNSLSLNKIPEDNSIQNNYDIESDIQREIQELIREKATRYDDNGKTRNSELQKQFMELYQKEEPEAHNIQRDELLKRKQMVRNLIREFNNDKAAGSKF